MRGESLQIGENCRPGPVWCFYCSAANLVIFLASHVLLVYSTFQMGKHNSCFWLWSHFPVLTVGIINLPNSVFERLLKIKFYSCWLHLEWMFSLLWEALGDCCVFVGVFCWLVDWLGYFLGFFQSVELISLKKLLEVSPVKLLMSC